jgi:hypothetical protein
LATNLCTRDCRRGGGLSWPSYLAELEIQQIRLRRRLWLCIQVHSSHRAQQRNETHFFRAAGSPSPPARSAMSCALGRSQAFHLIFPLFLLDFPTAAINISRRYVIGLFSVPAPLFDLLAGSSAGFFIKRLKQNEDKYLEDSVSDLILLEALSLLPSLPPHVYR